MNLRERINQINSRLSAIEAELRSATVADTIEKLSLESSNLIEERGRLTAQMQSEAIRAMEGSEGKELDIESRQSDQKSSAVAKMAKRDKLAFVIGRLARKKPFSDIEKRELGKSLTTTATTFVEATSSADGVNNGGVFISTKLVYDFLKEEGKLSPIFADVSWTYIKGLVDFPYRESRTKAQAKAEGKTTPRGQYKWSKLTGIKGYLQLTMEVTDEVQALSDIELGEYIANQLLQDLTEDFSEEIIYGTGTDNRIEGITKDVTAKTYAEGKAFDALIAGIKACTGKFRRGAKIYCAQDIYDEIFFSVDANGNFKYPVFNNPKGITSLGTIHIEVDENLHDGDFVIGNVNKYYKANSLIGMRLESERDITAGATLYVVNEYAATAKYPGAFIYGKKAA